MARRRGARPAYRLIGLLGCLAFGLIAIGGRLVQLQVVRASAYSDLGAKQRVRNVELPARRGGIYDRNGVPLAVSVEARAIYANPHFVVDASGTAKALSQILSVDSVTLKAKLTRKDGFVYLARKVDVAAARRIIELELPGIGSLAETKRVYPQGTLAGQIVGFVGIDDQGLSGIESGFEKILAGTPGKEIVEQDPQGRPIAQGKRSITRPVRGKDIVLTIDRDVQFQAERAVEDAVKKSRANSGIAVVLDARTNEVLAMANYPAFDPARYNDFARDARRNRAVQDAYEPGSVNKLVTAGGALEFGVARPSDVLTVPYTMTVANNQFRDFEPHPTWTIPYAEVLARSSNTGTIQIALRLGPKRMFETLNRFGLGSKTGVEFPSESPGISLPLKDWSGTSIATIPIGQGIAVTPLQMANVYSTIARDGVWMTPRLVQSIGGAAQPPKNASRRAISTFNASQLRAMLLNNVENGTGRSARIPGYLIGGKTGTAYKPLVGRRGYSNDLVTTFMGMLPVDRPQFVVGVALDTPRAARTSAETAAPAFQRLASFLLSRTGVPPQMTPSRKDARKAIQVARAPAPPAPAKPSPAPATLPPATKPKPSPTATPQTSVPSPRR